MVILHIGLIDGLVEFLFDQQDQQSLVLMNIDHVLIHQTNTGVLYVIYIITRNLYSSYLHILMHKQR
jgi:hypothetical protein